MTAPAAASAGPQMIEKTSRSYIAMLHVTQFLKNSGECEMNCWLCATCVCRITLTHCSVRSWSLFSYRKHERQPALRKK